MRLSRFNIWVEDYPKKGECLVFNSRTQALLKVDCAFKEALHAYVSGPSKKSEQGWLVEASLDSLKKNGIVAENEQEEEAKLDDFFRQLKHESCQLAFEATVLTTYSCNFRCAYCFEESVREGVFLDKETSIAIVNWLIKRAQKRKLARIHIVYYGGEPLLNPQPIFDISWLMQEWAKKNSIEFGFSIITNGSLVRPDLVDKFLSLGLKQIRVTIDGDRETHDKKRPLAGGAGTFDLIIGNIEAVIGKVDIGVAGNFDRESFPAVLRLLDYLEEKKLLRRLSGLNFSPIVPRLGPKERPQAIELAECISFVGKDGLVEETMSLKKELLRRGIKGHTGLAINACPLFIQDAGVTIDPTGAIYKCNSLVGYPEFSVGDVRKEEFNENFEKFFNLNAWEKCPKDCPYVPMCQGGCRFLAYVEHQDFACLSCKREYLDRIAPELIKLEYLNLCHEAR